MDKKILTALCYAMNFIVLMIVPYLIVTDITAQDGWSLYSQVVTSPISFTSVFIYLFCGLTFSCLFLGTYLKKYTLIFIGAITFLLPVIMFTGTNNPNLFQRYYCATYIIILPLSLGLKLLGCAFKYLYLFLKRLISTKKNNNGTTLDV